MQQKPNQGIELPIDGRAAERWAYEFHGQAMAELPPQIRHNIDWDLVASDLQGESPDAIPADVLLAIFRIVDFLVPRTSDRADVVHDDLIEAVKSVKEWADEVSHYHDR